MHKWWENDPKAVEAVEYLQEIGFNADELAEYDAEQGFSEPDEDAPEAGGIEPGDGKSNLEMGNERIN